MLWIFAALLSAALLGFYDVSKKQALRDNAVLPVLMLNTLICALLFVPAVVGSACGLTDVIPAGTLSQHLYILVKAILVLSSWICGYYAMKHLPITLVGPINATRPVFTLLGAVLIYSEQLNGWQWAGVALALCSFFLLSSNRKHMTADNASPTRWLICLVLAAVLGGMSGLYDKFLLSPADHGGLALNRYFVQAWYNIYQAIMMTAVMLCVWWPTRHSGSRFEWRWGILLIPLFLTAADLVYFYALSCPGALIAVVSMVRRSCVVVSFTFGALLFHEKHLRKRGIELILVVISALLLSIGSIK